MQAIAARSYAISIIWPAILGISMGASAQTIYKQVDATGHIVFSDRPDPAARVVTRFLPPSGLPFDLPPLQFSANGAPPDTRSDVENALTMSSAISSAHSISIDVNEATRRQRQEKLQRELEGAQRRTLEARPPR
jgi:hypothetical protein